VIVEIVTAREAFPTQRDLALSAQGAMYSAHVSSKMLDADKSSPTDLFFLWSLRFELALEGFICRIGRKVNAFFAASRRSGSHALLGLSAAMTAH
jgi:hypothetical protein